METFIILGITLIIVLTVVYALYDVKNNKNLSKNAKVNWTLFVLLVPFTGALIYFVWKMFKREYIKRKNPVN